jgi:hypothetical protein
VEPVETAALRVDASAPGIGVDGGAAAA